MKKKWWHGKVAYQIYPKSFCDSNDDGIGDLKGIISKLDYLAWLGIDIIWISPVYPSPFVDQGYDISDYYSIDPIFGNLEDMEALLEEAKKRDIAIVMDLVVNHCSDQHIWFQEMLKNPDGPYGDYFYIKEGKDGKAPCNWRSYFGGSVWEPIEGTNKYYLHLFAKEQPDLNWENHVVRQEIYKMMNWWLEKGIAGFRIDAIINIKKDLSFSDLPPDKDDGLCSCVKMLERAEDVKVFLREMREHTFDKYKAFSIGELFNYREEELTAYIGDEGCFSSIFDFSTSLLGFADQGWHERQPITPKQFKDTLFASQCFTQNIGFLANIIENHDQPRGVSRYIPNGDGNDQAKSMLATIMMMLRGLPFLYQGQEIGMTNNQFQSIDDIDDIGTKEAYSQMRSLGYTEEEAMAIVNDYSRDHTRTPMQWDDGVNAGFTMGDPWLVVNDNYSSINVAAQKEDKKSLLHFYRQLIQLRKDPIYAEAVVYGEFEPVKTLDETTMAFLRRTDEKTLLIVANYSSQEKVFCYEAQTGYVLLDNYHKWFHKYIDSTEFEKGIELRPYQTIILEVQSIVNNK